MGTFNYCSSRDELNWNIGEDYTLHSIILHRDNLLGNIRMDIRLWIKNHCMGDVYCWNGVDIPAHGDKDWSSKIIPQGHVSLYFTDERDFMFFKLKWERVIT